MRLFIISRVMRTSLERFVGVARISAQAINQAEQRILSLFFQFVKPTKRLSVSSARPLASRAARRQWPAHPLESMQYEQ
jgi:hypothetical protein